jgi:hypothetical protein
MGAARRSLREPDSEDRAVTRRVSDALTDLSAYVLTLDAERLRLHDLLLMLAEAESSVTERRALIRERDDIAEELTALRRAITALHEQVRQQAPVRSRPTWSSR